MRELHDVVVAEVVVGRDVRGLQVDVVSELHELTRPITNAVWPFMTEAYCTST
jgi:hypothetical protein